MELMWTVEKIKEAAAEYTTRTSFKDGCFGAYRAAKRYGIFEDVVKHMASSKIAKKWDVDSLQEIAMQYKTISEFRKQSFNAYAAASRKKLLLQITTHMEATKWTVVRIIEAANRCTSTAEFRKDYLPAYRAASDKGILKAITKHYR